MADMPDTPAVAPSTLFPQQELDLQSQNTNASNRFTQSSIEDISSSATKGDSTNSFSNSMPLPESLREPALPAYAQATREDVPSTQARPIDEMLKSAREEFDSIPAMDHATSDLAAELVFRGDVKEFDKKDLEAVVRGNAPEASKDDVDEAVRAIDRMELSSENAKMLLSELQHKFEEIAETGVDPTSDGSTLGANSAAAGASSDPKEGSIPDNSKASSVGPSASSNEVAEPNGFEQRLASLRQATRHNSVVFEGDPAVIKEAKMILVERGLAEMNRGSLVLKASNARIKEVFDEVNAKIHGVPASTVADLRADRSSSSLWDRALSAISLDNQRTQDRIYIISAGSMDRQLETRAEAEKALGGLDSAYRLAQLAVASREAVSKIGGLLNEMPTDSLGKSAQRDPQEANGMSVLKSTAAELAANKKTSLADTTLLLGAVYDHLDQKRSAETSELSALNARAAKLTADLSTATASAQSTVRQVEPSLSNSTDTSSAAANSDPTGTQPDKDVKALDKGSLKGVDAAADRDLAVRSTKATLEAVNLRINEVKSALTRIDNYKERLDAVKAGLEKPLDALSGVSGTSIKELSAAEKKALFEKVAQTPLKMRESSQSFNEATMSLGVKVSNFQESQQEKRAAVDAMRLSGDLKKMAKLSEPIMDGDPTGGKSATAADASQKQENNMTSSANSAAASAQADSNSEESKANARATASEAKAKSLGLNVDDRRQIAERNLESLSTSNIRVVSTHARGAASVKAGLRKASVTDRAPSRSSAALKSMPLSEKTKLLASAATELAQHTKGSLSFARQVGGAAAMFENFKDSSYALSSASNGKLDAALSKSVTEAISVMSKDKVITPEVAAIAKSLVDEVASSNSSTTASSAEAAKTDTVLRGSTSASAPVSSTVADYGASLRSDLIRVTKATNDFQKNDAVKALSLSILERRSISVSELDPHNANGPTTLLDKLERVVSDAARGDFGSAAKEYAIDAQSVLSRLRQQDNERIGASSSAADPTVTSKVDRPMTPKEEQPAAPLGAAEPTAEQKASSDSNIKQGITEAAASKMLSMLRNPPGAFLDRSHAWDMSKISEFAKQIEKLDDKALGQLPEGSRTKIHMATSWFAESAARGAIPGFNSDEGKLQLEAMRQKADVMKTHGVQENGSAFDSQFTDLLKAQNMVNAKEQLELQKGSATNMESARESLGGSKKEQAVSLGRDVVHFAEKGSSLSSVEATSILKNSGLLTAQNLKSMSSVERGQIAGTLKGIADAVSDGGLSKYSPPALKMAKAAASVASSLQASIGKDALALDAFNDSRNKAFTAMSGGAVTATSVQLREPTATSDRITQIDKSMGSESANSASTRAQSTEQTVKPTISRGSSGGGGMDR